MSSTKEVAPEDPMRKPDFLIIGAQKAGTTWLWDVLKHHPSTNLPSKKEIHYFGSAELYHKGRDWYYAFFEGLDPGKVTGEASSTYLYDFVPFWHNKSNRIEIDRSLPKIPELVARELPDVKIIIALRDPVRRAVSAYLHYMRRGRLSPLRSLREAATQAPKLRILEYGFYATYIKLWRDFFPPERVRVFIFEDDIVKAPSDTARAMYSFLGLDEDFQPEGLQRASHAGWSWTRTVAHHYSKRASNAFFRTRLGHGVAQVDPLKLFAVSDEDIRFLRDRYLPQMEPLERLLDRSLGSWTYDRT